jgi:ankyrin repeat protein
MLLARGAEINAQDSQSGTTALYAAASFGRNDVAALLLEEGADPNICSREGKCPLEVAIENGNAEVANSIRQHSGRTFRQQH